jgi:hypothetical protein
MTASICIVPGRNGVRDHGNQSIGAEIEHIGDANASDRGRHLPPLISDRRVGTGRLIWRLGRADKRYAEGLSDHPHVCATEEEAVHIAPERARYLIDCREVSSADPAPPG